MSMNAQHSLPVSMAAHVTIRRGRMHVFVLRSGMETIVMKVYIYSFFEALITDIHDLHRVNYMYLVKEK